MKNKKGWYSCSDEKQNSQLTSGDYSIDIHEKSNYGIFCRSTDRITGESYIQLAVYSFKSQKDAYNVLMSSFETVEKHIN